MIHDQARLQKFNYMIHDQARLQIFNYMIHDQDHDHSTIEGVLRPQSVSLGHHVAASKRIRHTGGVDRCRTSCQGIQGNSNIGVLDIDNNDADARDLNS